MELSLAYSAGVRHSHCNNGREKNKEISINWPKRHAAEGDAGGGRLFLI